MTTQPEQADLGAPPVREGDILAGKYRVDRILGAGGMGVVVAARHITLDQMVALKFVLPSALTDSSAVERFEREARAAAKLKSEHVAKVIDFGKLETGVPYMVMEYLDGIDLAALLAQDGPLSVGMATDFILQACEALAEAHISGIVHRDIKPQNLFLARGLGGAPIVKVLDFGISKLITKEGALSSPNLTRTATIMGSPLYMAPEQLRSSRNLDARIDIWALGIVLYELLAGRPPFEAETMTELTLRIAQDPPRPLAELRSGIPAALVALIEKCLEKSPDRRYQDAGDLATALASFAPPASSVVAMRALQLSKSGGHSSVAPFGSGTPADGVRDTVALPSDPAMAPSSPSLGRSTRSTFTQSQPGAPYRSRSLMIGGAVLLAASALLTGVLIARSPVGARPPAAAQPVVPIPEAAADPVRAAPAAMVPAPKESAPPVRPPVPPVAEKTAAQEMPLLPAAKLGSGPHKPIPAPAVAPQPPPPRPTPSAHPIVKEDDIPSIR